MAWVRWMVQWGEDEEGEGGRCKRGSWASETRLGLLNPYRLPAAPSTGPLNRSPRDKSPIPAAPTPPYA